MRKPGLTTWIMLAMFAGICTGLLIHYLSEQTWIVRFSDGMSILTDIFLRLIKMIIAPLVFSTLVTGIAKMGDTKAVGRIGTQNAGLVSGRFTDFPAAGIDHHEPGESRLQPETSHTGNNRGS